MPNFTLPLVFNVPAAVYVNVFASTFVIVNVPSTAVPEVWSKVIEFPVDNP